MASNEDAGIQLNVIQGLETLPLLRVPVFLAEPEIALLQILPMRLPRTAVAPWPGICKQRTMAAIPSSAVSSHLRKMPDLPPRRLGFCVPVSVSV